MRLDSSLNIIKFSGFLRSTTTQSTDALEYWVTGFPSVWRWNLIILQVYNCEFYTISFHLLGLVLLLLLLLLRLLSSVRDEASIVF